MGRTGKADPLTQLSAPSTPTNEWLTFFSGELAVRPAPAVLGAVLAAGIVFDLAVRTGPATVAGTLCVLFGVAILLGSGRVENGHGRALLGVVPLFAAWLALRTSPWLASLNVMACAGLLFLGAALARSGSIWDLSVPRLVLRSLQAAAQLFLTPAYLARSVASNEHVGRRRFGGILRGVAIALPLMLLLGALLASGDAVFARFFEFNSGDWGTHVARIAVGTLGMATLVRLASIRYTEPPPVPDKRLGVEEWTIVLGALDVLFAAFAVARLMALSEGGRRVIESAGLTYAEYARSGFFQLLAAAAIAGTSLVALRAVASTEDRAETRFRVMALIAVALTLSIVASAFHRLVLYEDAFGLTMLRLFSHTAIVWVGVVLILLGIVLLTRPQKPWLTPAAGLTAIILLFALNVMNPEAYVAEHNLADERRSAEFDPMYLLELGDDAVPTIADNLDRVGEDGRVLIKDHLCRMDRRERSWTKFNLARRRAEDSLARLCR